MKPSLIYKVFELRLFRVLAALLIVLTLSSCELLRGEKDAKNQNPPASSKTTKTTAADNVAKFLMHANLGERRTLTLKDGRKVTVVAGARYTSALGLPCRRASIANSREEALVNAACLENFVWKTVIQP